MGRVQTKVGAIGVVEAGGGPLTPILFLHGVGSDKSVWHPQLASFASRRRAIAMDYPGYGESDLQADATRDDFARSALALLDALGVEQVHVCGLSLGGVVAIAMAHLAPARCVSLVIADSFAVHPDGQAIHDRSVAASEAMPMAALATARAPALLGPAASSAVKDVVVATMSRIDPIAFRIGARAVWLADQRERVATLAMPTLVVVGAEDGVTPPSLSHDLAARVGTAAAARPPVELVEIRAAGHLANLEQPDAFNEAVDRFLTGTELIAERLAAH